MPAKPRHTLRWPLERGDERTALGAPHAHGAVEARAREQCAIGAEAESGDRVRVAFELAERGWLADTPQVADIVATTGSKDLGHGGVDTHGKDSIGVNRQLLHAMVLRGWRQLRLHILHGGS